MSKEDITLSGLVRQAFEKTKDRDKVRQFVVRRIDQIEDLKEALLRPAVESAIQDYVNSTRRIAKAHAMHAIARGNEPRGLSFDAAAVAQEAVTRALLDTWVCPDKRVLGDADRDSLVAWAADCRVRAKGELDNASFYERLAARLRGDQVVRAVLKNEDAERILQDVMGGGDNEPSRRGWVRIECI